MKPNLSVALIQSAPCASVERNLAVLAESLGGVDADLVVFPENCMYAGAQSSIAGIAREEGEWVELLGALAERAGVSAVFGGVPVRDGEFVLNSTLVLGAGGLLLARYDKIHLFQLFGEAATVDETQAYKPGAWKPVRIDVNGWDVGVSICYDLRFPELYREYAECDAMICTAAFTRHTGRAHWELLCRARAVENQCWFIAAGACGKNEVTGHESWGHSMIVDPWGRVAASAEDEPAVVQHQLDQPSMMAVRRKLPALKSRRI